MGEKKDVHDEKTGRSWPCFELMNMNERPRISTDSKDTK